MADIRGKDRVALLKALWEESKPYESLPGEKVWIPKWHERLAREALHGYVDHFQGRIIMMDFRGDSVGTVGYNQENGDGKAERIIASVE